MSDLELGDPVALRQADPDHKLVEGQIGCITEIFSPDEFEVEFDDGVGGTIAILRLNLQQVRLLRHEATLTEQEFWKLIENAKADNNGDAARQMEILADYFAQRSIADIYELYKIISKFHNIADRTSLWAACFIINVGCSNDGFMDFRSWLILQGEKVFHDALHDPESLVDTECAPGRASAGTEFLASRAYENKTGQERVFFCGASAPPDDWEDVVWNKDTVHELYPKLSAKFASWRSAGQ
jgi:hypothetical protein